MYILDWTKQFSMEVIMYIVFKYLTGRSSSQILKMQKECYVWKRRIAMHAYKPFVKLCIIFLAWASDSIMFF